MAREEAKEFPPITQAFVKGKTIQDWIKDTWKGKKYTLFGELSQSPIKPQPKYRPFKSQEECWNEMLKHQPFGWVKDEYNYVHIECVLENVIEFSPVEDDDGTLLTCTIDFTSVCEQGYTFADGTPFGIKE